MWIFSPSTGFLSVVVARASETDPTPDLNHLNIRARDPRHLELLQRSSPDLAQFEIIESSAGRDYPVRLVPIPKRAFAQALFDLCMDLDYENHKSASARSGCSDAYQDVLHAVWTATRQLQR